ncbi:MAG: hypothetical protein ACRD1T_26265, partial [Acidimicrobiia bacterium]
VVMFDGYGTAEAAQSTGGDGGGSGDGGVDADEWRDAVEDYAAEKNVLSFNPGLEDFCHGTPSSVAQAQVWAPACLGANTKATAPSFEERFKDITGSYYTDDYHPPTELERFIAEQALFSVVGAPLIKGILGLAARGASWARRALQATRGAASLADEAASIFTRSGGLQDEVIAASKQIIPGSKLGNPSVIKALTADGSEIAEWGKYVTPMFRSPSGPFQVHFYYNRVTGAVNYAWDYKSVFTGR